MNSDPQFLHKYRALDGGGLERVRETLIRKVLWLSRPDDFNDPFDCFPVIDTSLTREGLKEIARRVAERRGRNRPKWEKRQELKSALHAARRGRMTRDEAQQIAVSTMAQIRENMGVLSLSEEPDNVLMWSHYAQSHSGVVLSFRTNSGDLISEAQQVRYSADRPVVDFVGDRENTMVKTLLRKADYWSYEREWRVIRTGRPGLHSFNPDSLASIIFGARTRPEHISVIKRAASIGGLKVNFGRAQFDQNKFRLNIIDA